MGFDTPEEGYLAKIVLPAGTSDIPIGKLICIIVQDEKDIMAFKDFVDVPDIVVPPVIPPVVDDITIITPEVVPELVPIEKPEVLIASIISLYSLFRIQSFNILYLITTS